MSALKIVFIAGDRTIVLYGLGMKQMWQVESHVLERLGKEERLRLDTAQFRKYWIDDEGDRIEIINDVDYDFFLRRASTCNKTPKIYFEARYPDTKDQQETQASSSSSPPRERQNLSVHRTVSCDMCNAVPVVGFRYKCLQCPNFDLCMKCEGEMKHPEHLMVRIPTSDSRTLESICPMATVFLKRHRQRKNYAAEVAAAAAAAANPSAGRYYEAPQAEGKSRHHRHHRRHCGNGSGGAGIWSNFYDMMQDLAEGGAVAATAASEQQETSVPSTGNAATPTAESAGVATAAAAAAAAAVNSQSKETNTSPDRSSTSSAGAPNPPRYSASAPPSFENLQNFIDPTFMKAGIQILNNFSEMFGKILEPVPTADTSRGTSSPSSVVIDLTSENRASTTPPPTVAETPNVATCSKAPSVAGSGVVTPMETEVSPPSPVTPPEALPRSRNSQSEENDWTMIDNNIATSTTTDTAAVTASTAAAAVAASTPPMDFAKLSQQLQSHIENERKLQEQQIEATAATQATLTAIPSQIIPQIPTPIPVTAPVAPIVTPVVAPVPPVAAAPAPTTPDTTERRAVAVFHSDARINNAVHAMMAMGFSNEGAVLTQLLESVDGNIPVALDLMSAAQRN